MSLIGILMLLGIVSIILSLTFEIGLIWAGELDCEAVPMFAVFRYACEEPDISLFGKILAFIFSLFTLPATTLIFIITVIIALIGSLCFKHPKGEQNE